MPRIINTRNLLSNVTIPQTGSPSSTTTGTTSTANTTSGGTASAPGTIVALASVTKQRNDNPSLTGGTIGTKGTNSGPYTEDAYTLAQIEQGVKDSEAKTALRKRAITIAYSYIGNNEVKGDNLGFFDPLYQAKMEGLRMRWKPGYAWCNCFCNLVWYEAFNTGNALVPAAPQSDKDNWIKYLNNGGYGPKSGTMSLSRACAATWKETSSYKNGKYTITGDQALSAVGVNHKFMPQPGDLMIVSNGHHICMVAKVILKPNGKIKQFWTIEGNGSNSDPRDGGLTYKKTARKIVKSGKYKTLGFVKLEENYD